MLLVIGNKRYSSWSLRPWVLMKHFEIPFDEKLIPLDQPQTREEILRYSPSAKVPALIDGDITVWESLAIAEYLHEKFPDRGLWPQDRKARAQARSISHEMHGGFTLMRAHLSHDIQKKLANFDYSPAQADIDRVVQIWKQALRISKGPFLFGAFCIADAMYAPVVNRFVSYGVAVDGDTKAYIDNLRSLPAHRAWIDAALQETLRMPRYEND
jgi:glutathione S-transferase